MARLFLENLTKQFAGAKTPSLDDLNLEVHDGELVVLVGPSGCGKTTTLRLVSGLEIPTLGRVRVDEKSLEGVPPARRDMAMMFQHYALYPHMSVYRNMAFGLHLRHSELGMTHAEIRTRVTETARTLGLESLLNRMPTTLSGGQRQRVALGRAMVRQPKVFLFDEPLSNLDAQLRKEMRAMLKRLQLSLKTTTLYVTHDQEEAMTLGDRIVVLRQGVVQQAAPPLQVYEQPANRFVAGFVGSPAMNFLEGRIDGGYFLTGTWRVPMPAVRNGPAVLGIRPEALRLASDGEGMAARVVMVEPLGDRVDVTLEAEGAGALICRTDAGTFGKLAIGSIMNLTMDLGRVHLFEPGETGVRIALTRETSHATA